MPNHDLIGSDQDVSHEETDDTLTILDRSIRGAFPKAGEEAAQVLGQGHEGFSVGQLAVESIKLGADAGLSLAQLRHA